MGVKIIGREELRAKGITLTNPTLLAHERAGNFPSRVYFSPHRCGWIESEIDKWLLESAPRLVNTVAA